MRRYPTNYISLVSRPKNHLRNGAQVFGNINNSGPRGNHSLTHSTASLRLGYNAAYGAISHQILPMSDEILPAVGHEDRTNQIQKTATLKPVICISS